MISIEVNESIEEEFELLEPKDMLNQYWSHGTIFRIYTHGLPGDDYWIHCGTAEKRLINIWFDDESGEYRLSTDNKKSLKEFLPHVKVTVLPHAKLDITLEV